MKAPARFLVLPFLALACYAKKVDNTDGPISGTGFPLPDGGMADSPGNDAASSDTASNAIAPDGGGADRPPPSPTLTAYQQYLDQQWKAWSARWVTCFNTAPEALSPGRSPLYDDSSDQHAYSLEHGLVVLDAAGAKACLDALQSSSCEDLVASAYHQVCAKVLVGKVASGGFCASNEDCQTATDSCQMKEMHGCLSRCAPAPTGAAIGEPCNDVTCAAGAYCAVSPPPAQDARCRAQGGEGASCEDALACAAGTWCQPTAAGSDAGTCRKLQAGLACAGSWQCPSAYACLIPSGSTGGTCQPGHKKGEACTFHGKDVMGGPYHDCASDLYCYRNPAGQLTCGVGYELGDSCADFDGGGMTPVSVPCRMGTCRADAAGKPTCLADQQLGQACSDDLPCTAGLACVSGKCVDPVVAVGERCTSDGNSRCPDGARCAFSTATSGQGTCVLIKKIGETCDDPDACEAGASCAGGVCTACK
jgi:hypothetical protein